MSSVASYNAFNESPNKGLQAQPDIDATLLRSIANGLLQTITNCESNIAIAKKAYEDHVHHLEQRILHYEDTFNHAPDSFVLNNRQVSNFHIPVGDGLYQEAKWICLNDDSTVSGYTTEQGPNQQAYIINLYTAPNNSVDLPINALPAWFWHMLTGPGGDFHILQTTVADTDDWGLAREITWYREIDDSVTHLAIKIKEYQQDLEVAQASLTACESCLMLAQAAEHIEPLCNIPRKMATVHLGWKRSGHSVQSTYVQGRPL
jgi:hypothetical protein